MVGTDGLFDNLFDEQIKELIDPYVISGDMEDPGLVADVIANETEKYSRMPNYLSPFAKGAREQMYHFMGGKQDDITVAVAQIKLHSEETSKPL